MTPTPTVTSRPGIYDQQRPLAHQLLKDIVEAHQTVAQQVIESWLSRMPEAYFRYIFCIYILFAYTYYLRGHIICMVHIICSNHFPFQHPGYPIYNHKSLSYMLVHHIIVFSCPAPFFLPSSCRYDH
jgi:hypothetical protein